LKFVGVTSCPTGIAHTYMAAEGLEQAAKAAGHTIVAAGGILIALGFMLAQIAWGETGAVLVTKVPLDHLITDFSVLSTKDWAALLFQVGAASFGFLVPILAGFIAFAIADRPGLAPGIVGGALAVVVGAGFLGGIAAGFVGGFIALWISSWKVPKGLRGVMPVVVIPLLSVFATGLSMIVILGPPLKALSDGLTSWLNGLTGTNLILLGVLLGLMMAFDMGGPVNKVAYTFARAGERAGRLAARSFLHHRRRHPVRGCRPAPGHSVLHAGFRRDRWSGDALRKHAARSARWHLGDAVDQQPAALHPRDRDRHADHRRGSRRSQGGRARSGQDRA